MGLLISLLGLTMLFPAFVDAVHGNNSWQTFVLSSLVALFLGAIMLITTWDNTEKLSKKDVFILIPLSWFLLPLIASIPFYTSNLDLSFTNAYFEAVSGVTTTGATVLTELDTTAQGILMWRSLLQWMGGIGIVVMASGVLPIMQVGGMQLLQLEFDPRMEKALPKTAQLSLVVVIVYSVLTLVCAALYFIFGMSGFDAINHAMTTVATGGYSTHDNSMAFFNNSNILITSTIFMMVASMPFVLVITAFRVNITEFFKDVQAKWFVVILTGATALMIWNNNHNFDSLIENITHTAFNLTSVITGTGYTTTAYDEWGGIAIPLILLLMMLGGGAGSTTCGLKMFRIKILFESIRAHFKGLIHPNGVFVPYYGKMPIKQEVSIYVLSYISVFLFTVFIFGGIFSAMGYDFLTAFSAAITSLACVGPGLGYEIGPNTTYQDMSDSFKWVFSMGMLIGRLEIFTVLILMTPSFWRD